MGKLNRGGRLQGTGPVSKKRGREQKERPPPGTGGAHQPVGNVPSPRGTIDKAASLATLSPGSGVPVTNVGRIDTKVQQAKNLAVAQAQQEGCTGTYRSFGSQFGNFLVPVIPTLADLSK